MEAARGQLALSGGLHERYCVEVLAGLLTLELCFMNWSAASPEKRRPPLAAALTASAGCNFKSGGFDRSAGRWASPTPQRLNQRAIVLSKDDTYRAARAA